MIPCQSAKKPIFERLFREAFEWSQDRSTRIPLHPLTCWKNTPNLQLVDALRSRVCMVTNQNFLAFGLLGGALPARECTLGKRVLPRWLRPYVHQKSCNHCNQKLLASLLVEGSYEPLWDEAVPSWCSKELTFSLVVCVAIAYQWKVRAGQSNEATADVVLHEEVPHHLCCPIWGSAAPMLLY